MLASVAAVLECDRMRKRYGERTVVDDVTFSIAEGETYGLLGPNGAGKTTSISMVVGLLRRDGGSIHVDGIDIDDEPAEVKARIGYVPQDLALYPDLTGRENLTFFAKLLGLRRREVRARVGAVLELVELADRADERVDRYSGGMKRRLNIAVGLLNEPRLLILDEPTVGVDPQSRNAILTSVEALQAAGMAVLYTTHYMEEAQRLCRRVGIIDEGRLVAEGTRDELVARIAEHDRVHLRGVGDLDAAVGALRGEPGVLGASASADDLELLVDHAGERLPAILERCRDLGVAVSAVDVVEPDLEAVFLHLTGKALRD